MNFISNRFFEAKGVSEGCPAATWILIHWVDFLRIGNIPTPQGRVCWPLEAN